VCVCVCVCVVYRGVHLGGETGEGRSEEHQPGLCACSSVRESVCARVYVYVYVYVYVCVVFIGVHLGEVAEEGRSEEQHQPGLCVRAVA